MAGKEGEDIEMKPINKDVEPEISDIILADDGTVTIWHDKTNTVFVHIGNATVSMPEEVFYSLTKLAQQASKKLLGIE